MTVSLPEPSRTGERPVGVGLVAVAAGWLLLLVLCALFADVLSPHDHTRTSLRLRLLPPGVDPAHLLGTDHLGRDVLSRLLQSIRTSAVVVFVGSAIGAGIGIALGLVAAHFRGLVDDAVMVLVDFQASVPMLIVALAVLAFFGGNMTLFVVMVGLHGWERYARIARGLSLSLAEQGFATAVRSFGGGPVRLYLRHVLPNAAAPLMVNLTLNFPELILLESGLSFIGLGVQPPETSLGSMLGYGREYLTSAWWIAVLPGMVIVATTLAMSVVGDWLRDRFDPTLQT
jgi:peptide/nickel transport system permease protein